MQIITLCNGLNIIIIMRQMVVSCETMEKVPRSEHMWGTSFNGSLKCLLTI